MFGMIPLPYKILGVTLILIGAFVFGYMKGNARADVEITRYAANANQRVADLERKNSEISSTVVTEYVDRWHTVKEREYVYRDLASNSVPSQHDMSNGWVYLHDQSARQESANSDLARDTSPSGVMDNQALSTVVSNYAICTQNANQLAMLQEWIRQNQAAVEESNRKK